MRHLGCCSALLLPAGVLSCWHGITHDSCEESKTHRSRLTTLVWSTREATVFASGDDNGRLALWRVHAAATVSLLAHFDAAAQGRVSHIVFAEGQVMQQLWMHNDVQCGCSCPSCVSAHCVCLAEPSEPENRFQQAFKCKHAPE